MYHLVWSLWLLRVGRAKCVGSSHSQSLWDRTVDGRMGSGWREMQLNSGFLGVSGLTVKAVS